MTNNTPKLIVAVLALAFAISCIPVFAAPQAVDTSSIGVVDIQEVISQFQKKKDADTAVKNMAKGFEDKLQLRGTNKFLTETEINELESLKTKASPTDKDKARITELQDLDKKRNDELQELQGKASPSEADRARLRELQTMRKKSEETILQLSKEYRAELQKESAERGKALQTDIVDTIQKVSQEKGMTLVVDKQAVLFGGTDITKSIIEDLNKKK